ncbi:MAG: class I SAM-dependent methyltransferase, partial [candidate division NC10 bacterium]|nr:class I SAM-dependent methyltransferase [candidate division NC10 bacterium]
MNALDLKPSDVALDVGCGAGFFTVEMAKMARKAYGIDTNPYVKGIQVPPILRGRLEYIQARGEELPFPADHFDKILASEVLPMIPDPGDLLREIRRVLKPEGRLVIVNGAGHPALRAAWDRPGALFLWARWRYGGRLPASYQEYCAHLQSSFGTSQRRFFEEDHLQAMLRQNGFRSLQFSYTPGYLFGLYFSWSQLFRYLRSGRAVSQRNFLLPFCLFSLIRPF